MRPERGVGATWGWLRAGDSRYGVSGMRRLLTAIVLLLGAAALLGGTADGVGPHVAGPSTLAHAPIVEPRSIAEECGIDVTCKRADVAFGDSGIAHVPAFDAFFEVDARFTQVCDGLTASLAQQLAVIRDGFDVQVGVTLPHAVRLALQNGQRELPTVQAESTECWTDGRIAARRLAACSGMEGIASPQCTGECCTAVKGCLAAPAGACEGRCSGDLSLASDSIPCGVVAHAAARLEVYCVSPSVQFSAPAGTDGGAGNEDAPPRMRRQQALLERALPALIATTARADIVLEEGQRLRDAANGSVRGALGELDDMRTLTLPQAFGTKCAIDAVNHLDDVLAEPSDRLTEQRDEARALLEELGL